VFKCVVFCVLTFELVDGSGLTLGVYVIIYYTYYTIHYYYILLLLYIISYTILFSSSSSSSLPFPYSPLPLSLPHSFYTCRYLHILIYIPSGYLSSSFISQYSLLIHSILVGTYIYLFIFFGLSHSFTNHSFPSSFIYLPLPNTHPRNTCRYLDTHIYILLLITIRPRTFYRSGWLRCDVGNG
jgi:hypothetical protein